MSLRFRSFFLLTVLLSLLLGLRSAHAAANSITSPDSVGGVGEYTSLALDTAGFPVVSYFGNSDLKLLHCNDINCAGNNESITNPDTVGAVGFYTSLVLDANGFPVVGYYDITNSSLKLMHCNDINCAGNNESITSPDTAGDVGEHVSLALDAAGFPVISYLDFTNFNLKVLHCNDVNCAGNNESITSPDTVGSVGFDTSLVLDANGFPVISYYDGTNVDLKLIHCNDVNCAGNNESITSPDTAGDIGFDTSLALDANGFPVVSYYDSTNDDLKLLHCNDVNCAGNNESITSPDTAGNVGEHTSLVLDAAGFPVISYYDGGNVDLKLLHCNDVNCAGNNDTPTSPDTTGDVGRDNSLVLDSSGYPIVSYRDFTNFDLKLLHCAASDCLPDLTSPTVTINQTVSQVDPTSSSPINFTVVFNEPVLGFAGNDITLGGSAGASTAIVAEVAPNDGTTYTVAVSGMTGDGTVVASISAGVATDAGSNGNVASTSSDNTVTFILDTTAPAVVLSSPAPDPTNSSPIPVTVTFNETVTGFTADDITTNNATVANFFAVDGATYTFDLVPTSDGLITVDIAADVAQDAANNGNSAAVQFSRTFDTVLPNAEDEQLFLPLINR